MNERAAKLHAESIVVECHDHMMGFVASKKGMGEKGVVSKYFAPMMRQGGVNMMVMNVGADAPSCCCGSDNLLWGTLRCMNMLAQESEESSDTMHLCLSYNEIMETIQSGRIAMIMTIEGARPFEGKANFNSLDMLQTMYKLGLRQTQLVDMGRNQIGDGLGTWRSHGRLTPFGVQVVQEMERLGMVIDTVHLNDEGFFDVLEQTNCPIIDSHSASSAVCPWGHNISDERMKAMAQTGGVLGVSLYASGLIGLENTEKGLHATVDDWVRHVDHMVEVAGIDHVAFGSDHFPDHGDYPVMGYMEGLVYHGIRDTFSCIDAKDVTMLGNLTDGLVRRGYKDEDIKKIMGENILRVYKEVLK